MKGIIIENRTNFDLYVQPFNKDEIILKKKGATGMRFERCLVSDEDTPIDIGRKYQNYKWGAKMSIKEIASKQAEQMTMIIEAKIDKKISKMQSDLWKEYYKLLAEDFHALNIEFKESAFKKTEKDKEEEKKEEEKKDKPRRDYYCTFPPTNKNGDFRFTHHRPTGNIFVERRNEKTEQYESIREKPFATRIGAEHFISNYKEKK